MSNRFLEGPFAPVSVEQTVTYLPVTGSIPEHLDGRYLRNGPNPAAEVDPATYHWFTGDGMVHGVRLRDGRAEWYRNRWVRSERVAAALGEEFTQRRHRGGMELIPANTNVITHAGRTLALIEGGITNSELTEELDTVGACDFDGTLSGGYTAHPKRDPGTGELHAVSYSFARADTVQYSVIGTDGRARRTVDIEVTGSPMMHDFALTEKHVVLFDLPVTFDPRQAAEAAVPRLLQAPARLVISALIGRVRVPDPVVAAVGRRGGNGTLPYRWDPRYPARVGVMPRDGGPGDVRWFEVDSCYVFHAMNAYDEGDTVVVDVVRHPKMFDTELHGPVEGTPTLERWTIDLSAGKVREERVDERAQEFPRVDERLLGRRHRYGYAVSADFEDLSRNNLLHRHDLVARTTRTREFGPGRMAGEFVFVESGPDTAEDDGLLMGFVYDAADATTDLVMLDAASLEDVARVHVPFRIPAGFHGNWCPA